MVKHMACAERGLNKEIAGEIITETTVKVHRSNVMRKIKAAWVAEACRMVDRLKPFAAQRSVGGLGRFRRSLLSSQR